MESYLKKLLQATIVSIDTESTEDDKLWSVQFTITPGTAAFIHVNQKKVLAFLGKCLAKPNVLTLLHNALHDLPMLAQAEIYPVKPACTMLMAYLLQSEPQGLKPLAYRHAGMEMKNYKEMIRGMSEKKAIDYLSEIISRDWPAPDPVLEWKKEKPHIKQPQNINKKVRRIINDWVDVLKEIDPRERWHHIKPEEGRGPVEDRLGPMPEAYLSDIPHEEAVHYAGRDSDGTLRIYPYLWERIQTLGLEPTFWRDMRAMPLVVDMMKIGIKADPEHFKGLSKYFATRMQEIERSITHETGQSFNVGSFDQVAKLLFDHLKIPKIKGRSTDSSVLSRSVDAHPVVQMIRDWRSYQKLKTTYADQIPKKIQADGRVHATFRMTRTSTGRLSCAEPNLMAQPVKGEEGPKIREGFVASDGCYIVSNDYCLVGNTKVITEYGEQSIKDIRIGDGVLSSADGKTLTFNTVLAAAKIGECPAPAFELELEDGSRVQCTKDHSWMLYNGERCFTKDLQAGDRLAHVKEGRQGRYPIWYLKSNRNYFPKHVLIAEYNYGPRAPGFEVDHKDCDIENWHSGNIRYLPWQENRVQAGKRYWREVKEGKRSDDNRLNALRVGLKKRRSYNGKANPNYGKFNRDYLVCPICGKGFSQPKCHHAIYCSRDCYTQSRTSNHKVKSVKYIGLKDIFQITVDNTHAFVLANGLISFNSQIEMRVVAHDSQDTTMIQIFRDDKDIHTITAANVWDIQVQDIDEMKHRYPIKRVGFGILYDITAYGLYRTFLQEGITLWSQDDCQRIIDEWFKMYPGVKEYMKQVKLHARRYGYVKDLWDRIRYIPGARAANKYVQAEALRMAGNAPIQMGAQGVIKQAMGDLAPVCKMFRTEGTFNPLIQIHDDLVWEQDKQLFLTANPIVCRIMEEAVTLRVPVKVDTKYGETWGTMEKWKQ